VNAVSALTWTKISSGNPDMKPDLIQIHSEQAAAGEREGSYKEINS
jgi:hypothetical protein